MYSPLVFICDLVLEKLGDVRTLQYLFNFFMVFVISSSLLGQFVVRLKLLSNVKRVIKIIII